MPSYGWTMITKIVHQLKLLQFSRFDNRSPTMAGVITIYQKLMITLPATDKKYPIDSLPRSVPAV